MGPVDAPLAAVPAYPVISFEAAVVPGHLRGPRWLLTGKQSPDLPAQSEEEGGLDKGEPLSDAGGSLNRQRPPSPSSELTHGFPWLAQLRSAASPESQHHPRPHFTDEEETASPGSDGQVAGKI